MSKPTTEFNLDLRDIDHIENAINSVIARRSSAMSSLSENSAEKTMDISAYREIKQEVAALLQQETQKLTLIEANEAYVFDYIDPPAVMEFKSEPARSIICIIGAFLGALLGIFVVLFRHFSMQNKTNNSLTK